VTITDAVTDITDATTTVATSSGSLGVAVEELDAPRLSTEKFNPVKVVGPIGVFGLVMAIWYGGRLLMEPFKRFVLPPFHEIFTKGFAGTNSKGEYVIFKDVMGATWLDIKVAVIGLTIAIILGVSTAVVMSLAKWLEISFWPYLVALQAIPILTVAPLIGVVLGYSTAPRVFVTVVITIFPIISNTLFGLTNVDKGFHDLFTLHGANRVTRLLRLQLPTASPAIFAGFRISAGLAVIGAIVGDVFFRQGEAGLGLQVDVYTSRLNGAATWACILMAALLGLAFFGFFGWLESRVVGRWHNSKA
jgi:NitT/TauT family transport system permease protein